jgi:ketosteroid isomerase-like protein
MREDVDEEIRGLRAKSNRAMAARDVDTFAAMLEENYVMVRGNGSFASRETTLAAFGKDFERPGSVRYERLTERVEVSEAAEMAAEDGRWVAKLPDGRAAYGGTYLAMWRRSGEGWKIRSELFVLLTCEDAAVCKEYVEMGIRG